MYSQLPQDSQAMDVTHRLENLIAADDSSSLFKSQLQKYRNMARVSKPSSAGNSPQDYQRRRHTTSQMIPRQRRALYQQCLRTPPSSQFFSTARPVSWHPSSMIAQPEPTYTTTYAHGIPTPVSQPSTTWYSSEDLYQQSSDYDLYRNPEITSMQGGYYQQPSAVFSPVIYPAPIQGSLSTCTSFTAPATPDFLPLTTSFTTSQQSLLPRTESKELIGMGLYDGPDRNSWTLDNYVSVDHHTRPISLGKGLKLEETWEPPEEEDKTDDEEEDAEEEQFTETIQEQLQQVAKEAPQLPPMEISNHSFFDTMNAQTGFDMPSYGISF